MAVFLSHLPCEEFGHDPATNLGSANASPLARQSLLPQLQSLRLRMRTNRPRQSIGGSLQPPQSTAEWKQCLAIVKGHYSAGRYHECATCVNSVVAKTQSQDAVEKAHLIFLNFYAATALEMQCRHLHHASPGRLRLLSQAKSHYHTASKLISEEDLAKSHLLLLPMSPSTIPDSPRGSILFSAHSASTRLSSPCPSEEEEEEEEEEDTKTSEDQAFRSESAVLTVQADDAQEDISQYESEELVSDYAHYQHDEESEGVLRPSSRPDSPTLGLGGWPGNSSKSISHQREPAGSLLTIQLDAIAENERLRRQGETSKECANDGGEEQQIRDKIGEESCLERPPLKKSAYEISASIYRYRDILNSLQHQIKAHLSFIEHDIRTSQVSGRYFSPEDEQWKKMDLQARIERLKAKGWERRRFDAARYEALRENAMADLCA